MHIINTEHNTFFARYGYLKLENFLDETQLHKLRVLYSNCNLGKTNGKMYSNFHDLSFEQNQAIQSDILDICKDSVSRHLEDYKIIGASFIVKGFGSESDSRLHQDWSIVDEKTYNSLIVWIPLIDVDKNNGCLQVLPGSHKWFYTIRSSSVNSIFLKFNYKINPFLKAVSMKASEGALFNMKVFHGSKFNNSEQDRPAVTITLIDKDAIYVHYLKDKQGDIKILDCTTLEKYRNSYNLYNGNESSEVNVLGVLTKAENYQITEKIFLKKLYKERLVFIFFKKLWYRFKSGN